MFRWMENCQFLLHSTRAVHVLKFLTIFKANLTSDDAVLRKRGQLVVTSYAHPLHMLSELKPIPTL